MTKTTYTRKSWHICIRPLNAFPMNAERLIDLLLWVGQSACSGTPLERVIRDFKRGLLPMYTNAHTQSISFQCAQCRHAYSPWEGECGIEHLMYSN
jgi:hypothetical protein